MSIRIGIVEDHQGVRKAWATMIEAEEGFECVGSCASGEEALERFPAARPQVVLMDIGLPGMNGIECTARLKELLPQTQILIVTVFSDNRNLFEALKIGASGYLVKSAEREELIRSIREVVAGGAPMSGRIARQVLETFRVPPMETLSAREHEILTLLAQGMGAKEVAIKVNISYHTVRVHLCKIYDKLHVHSRQEAVKKFLDGKAAE